MTCHACKRTLIPRSAWRRLVTWRRNLLADTHAPKGALGLCAGCYNAHRYEYGDDIAYQGGWRRDHHGILRPIVTGGAE